MLNSKHILTRSHFNYNYTMSQSKHRPVWFSAPSMYQRIIMQRESDRSGEIRLGMCVVYNIIILARVLKLLFGKGPGIFLGLAHSTRHPFTDMKTLILWARNP